MKIPSRSFQEVLAAQLRSLDPAFTPSRSAPSARGRLPERSSGQRDNMRALDERDAPLTQARGTWRTIPEGLSKLQHVYEALRLPHPFQREGDVPSALKEAADNMIR